MTSSQRWNLGPFQENIHNLKLRSWLWTLLLRPHRDLKLVLPEPFQRNKTSGFPRTPGGPLHRSPAASSDQRRVASKGYVNVAPFWTLEGIIIDSQETHKAFKGIVSACTARASTEWRALVRIRNCNSKLSQDSRRGPQSHRKPFPGTRTTP